MQLEIIDKFKDIKIAVIGDLILDHYVFGWVERISPEAPVPVLIVEREEYRLGGAGNVANNISSLGGLPVVFGLLGTSSLNYNNMTNNLLDDIGLAYTYTPNGYETIVKSRVIATQQQIVRIDREKSFEMPSEIEANIIDEIIFQLSSVNAVVFADYDKGMITPGIIKAVCQEAKKKDIPIIADPKVKHFWDYDNVTVLKPNRKEAMFAVGNGCDDIVDPGKQIRRRLDIPAVLITQGADGMTLFEADGTTHIAAVAREVYDVTGAGDTVAATLAMALGAGINMEDAVELANIAAGISVSKMGTAVVTIDELEKEL